MTIEILLYIIIGLLIILALRRFVGWVLVLVMAVLAAIILGLQAFLQLYRKIRGR